MHTIEASGGIRPDDRKSPARSCEDLSAWIVERKGLAARTVEEVRELVRKANDIYRRVGVTLDIGDRISITSNSVAMVDECLSLTNKESRPDRENICKFMSDRFAGTQSPDGIRSIVERSVLGFAMSNTVYKERFDESLSQRIGGYKYSRRRLDVLRRARQIMEIPYNESFITNAINELVGYPGSDLPD